MLGRNPAVRLKLFRLTRQFARRLTEADVSEHVRRAEYSVLGPVDWRATQIKRDLASGLKFPFDHIIPCHVGNPFQLGKSIMTFPRQVLSVAEYPALARSGFFPDEAVERALGFINNGTRNLGALSPIQGFGLVRRHVADFITKRDGYPSDPSLIYLCQGATPAIMHIIRTIVNSARDAILTPQPQYPMYTAVTSLVNAQTVPYYLTEHSAWSVDHESLMSGIKFAHDLGLRLKGMVIINPGNPTGNLLSKSDMKRILDVVESEGMVLIADEVYQENVYGGREWFSFKKIAVEAHSQAQLVSINSVSKGFMGECGHRGGYIELHNFDPKVLDYIRKVFAIHLPPNSPGQLILDIVVNPPTGSLCGKQWETEKAAEISSLQGKGNLLYRALSALPGVTCQPPAGAMHLFPGLELPLKFLKSVPKGLAPDVAWTVKLLEEEGIVVSPGAGFGQKTGTHHFRITFLPSEETLSEVIMRLSRFQTRFMDQFT
jgi:alanine transaminase